VGGRGVIWEVMSGLRYPKYMKLRSGPGLLHHLSLPFELQNAVENLGVTASGSHIIEASSSAASGNKCTVSPTSCNIPSPL